MGETYLGESWLEIWNGFQGIMMRELVVVRCSVCTYLDSTWKRIIVGYFEHPTNY